MDVRRVPPLRENSEILRLLDEGKIGAIVYTGAAEDESLADYITLHRHALTLSIPCFTSLDTASALADILASRFTQQNTELVDLNHMRTARQTLPFAKLQGTGDDYIFFENFDGAITCPESLAVRLCHRHYGIGGDGVVLLERSQVADIRMRIFNQDGSEGRMAGNSIRGAAKLAHDRGYVSGEEITVETAAAEKAE